MKLFLKSNKKLRGEFRLAELIGVFATPRLFERGHKGVELSVTQFGANTTKFVGNTGKTLHGLGRQARSKRGP